MACQSAEFGSITRRQSHQATIPQKKRPPAAHPRPGPGPRGRHQPAAAREGKAVHTRKSQEQLPPRSVPPGLQAPGQSGANKAPGQPDAEERPSTGHWRRPRIGCTSDAFLSLFWPSGLQSEGGKSAVGEWVGEKCKCKMHRTTRRDKSIQVHATEKQKAARPPPTRAGFISNPA